MPEPSRILVRHKHIKNIRFTFRFESNHWLAEDLPARSQPKLPTQEIAGTYGQPVPKSE